MTLSWWLLCNDLGHSFQVDEGIAHTPQCGVDAAVGLLGDFLEGEVLVIAVKIPLNA